MNVEDASKFANDLVGRQLDAVFESMWILDGQKMLPVDYSENDKRNFIFDRLCRDFGIEKEQIS